MLLLTKTKIYREKIQKNFLTSFGKIIFRRLLVGHKFEVKTNAEKPTKKMRFNIYSFELLTTFIVYHYLGNLQFYNVFHNQLLKFH